MHWFFYQERNDWDLYNPEQLKWVAANSRTAPLNGCYVARVPATTAIENGEKISRGFNTTGMKGAGIRLFEYASKKFIDECRIQLEAIFWLCYDSMDAVTKFDMSEENAVARKDFCLSKAQEHNLLDIQTLVNVRITDFSSGKTICPFCLEPLSGFGFFKQMHQAMGREVHNLTITEINLFHIQELKYGKYNHRPYNLGWGHHHCNVVVKDSGIDQTIKWMSQVVQKNIDSGYFES